MAAAAAAESKSLHKQQGNEVARQEGSKAAEARKKTEATKHAEEAKDAEAEARTEGPAATTTASSPETGKTTKVCYPGRTLPPVHLAAVHLPAKTLPARTVGGMKLQAVHVPAVDIPAQEIPGTTIPATCINTSAAFAPANTNVLDGGYEAVDPGYSPTLTQKYWQAGGLATETPDPTAAGFGELNAAGFPKNQYVRPYIRKDGTPVGGYWRNSPTDGLPTCKVISC